MVFALVGNQNCGKTTLFNQLTGSNQHVGNFPGVTVDFHELVAVYDFIAVFVVLGNDNYAFLGEQESDTAGLTEVSAEFVEVMAHISCRSVLVVCCGFDYYRNAGRTVSFVYKLFICYRIGAGAFFDRSFDIIVGNVVRLCFCDKIAEL